MKLLSALATAATSCLVSCLVSCGGGSGSVFTLADRLDEDPSLAQRAVDPGPASHETMQMLTSRLAEELQKLGKDLSSTASAVPSDGNQPIGIQAILLDADSNGQTPPYGVKLCWAEKLIGDYDQNGVVNVSDLTFLGRYFKYKVKYDPPELHDGATNIPAGDPYDYGEGSDGLTPQPDSGAFNWRLASIDGNADGEIGVADLTPMAQHWQESLDGYVVYRQGPMDADFAPMENTQGGEGEMTVRRFDVVNQVEGGPNPLAPIIYSVPDFYLLEEPGVDKTYTYKVAPYNSDSATTGPESEPVSVSPFMSNPNNGGIIPLLTAEIVETAGSQSSPAAIADIMGTAPLTVHFDASGSYVPDGMLVNYLWDFEGDGVFEASSGADPQATHAYTDNARFRASVKLIQIEESAGGGEPVVSSASAATYASVVTFSKAGNVPPYAKCLADRAFGPSPLTVNFDASTSSDDDGTVDFYEWDFDNDGNPDFSSSSPLATYTFSAPALSRVRLKVTDNDGGYDTTMIPIITSNADGDWPPTAALQINPALGSAPLTVMLDGSGSQDPDGAIVSYEWDLDGDFTFDINSGSESAFEYTFTTSGVYNVWLRVTDSAGQFDLVRALVNVNTAPYPGLEAIPNSGTGPLTVNFDASSSQDLDGTIVKYEWDFDSDGTYDQDTGILPRVTHTLYKIGTNTITVRVTDDLGFSSTQSVEIEVKAPQNNLTPTITLEADITDGAPPLTVLLTATAKDPDEDGGIDHYDWDYEGDGIYDESTDILGTTRQHEYEASGRYNPTVRVVDIAAGSATASVEVLVHQPGTDPPTADFSVNPLVSGSDYQDTFNFDASTSTDDSGIADYAWDFDGDGVYDLSGGASEAQMTQHAYFDGVEDGEDTGVYLAILKVTDDDGAVAFAWQQVVVGNVPQPVIVVDRTYAEVPNAVFNLDASRSVGGDGNIINFEWDLNGDGKFDVQNGVSPFQTVMYQLEDLVEPPVTEIKLHLRVTNEIGATMSTDEFMMPMLDENGNQVLDPETGEVQLVEVTPVIQDNYDEVENNDEYITSNFLLSTNADGKFTANPTGDEIQALRPKRYVGEAVDLHESDPHRVAGSLGELNHATVYDGDDNDWYAFELAEGARVKVAMTFTDASVTDLNLRLYDANGSTPVAQSLSIDSNEESVQYDFRDPGIYYIRVNRFVGQGQNYKLSLLTSDIDYTPEGNPDNNNSENSPTSLHDPDNGGRLYYQAWGHIGGSDTEDWYKFHYSAAVTVRIYCGFSHALADIDLYLYNQAMNLLAYSSTSDDDELIWRALPDPGGQSNLYLKVVAHSGDSANYILSAGYPAGQPRNLQTNVQTSGPSRDGSITISWSAPAAGGNTPSGYDLYVSDAENGYYTKLAEGLTSRTFVHQLSMFEDHNKQYWYRAKATRVGEQDSEFSNAAVGYVNGLMTCENLYISNGDFYDKIVVEFDDAPSDPALGAKNGLDIFGAEPAYYRILASNPYKPEDQDEQMVPIAVFLPGDGVMHSVEYEGGYRQAERFYLEWTGAPQWTLQDLRDFPMNITVESAAQGYPANIDVRQGHVASLFPPQNFSATQGNLQNKTRLSWTIPDEDDPPDSFIISYRSGNFPEEAWTELTNEPIPSVPGRTYYQYFDEDPEGAPFRQYRIRSFKGSFGVSVWTAPVYGWCAERGFKMPKWEWDYQPPGVNGDENGVYYFTVEAIDEDSIMPYMYGFSYNGIDLKNDSEHEYNNYAYDKFDPSPRNMTCTFKLDGERDRWFRVWFLWAKPGTDVDASDSFEDVKLYKFPIYDAAGSNEFQMKGDWAEFFPEGLKIEITESGGTPNDGVWTVRHDSDDGFDAGKGYTKCDVNTDNGYINNGLDAGYIQRLDESGDPKPDYAWLFQLPPAFPFINKDVTDPNLPEAFETEHFVIKWGLDVHNNQEMKGSN
jgi:PKD repeat protein